MLILGWLPQNAFMLLLASITKSIRVSGGGGTFSWAKAPAKGANAIKQRATRFSKSKMVRSTMGRMFPQENGKSVPNMFISSVIAQGFFQLT